MTDTLLEVDGLTVEYRTSQGLLTAVSDVSFEISEGEYLGLVGESGCGKSTIAKALLGVLDQNGRIASGSIRYKGTEIQDYSERELNERIRWKEISMIPQSSMNNLDPLESIKDQALEIANVHTDLSEREATNRFKDLFEIVGLQPERVSDHPYQFSGGMQQRAIIALALFLRPNLVIADEPTTALDVIMQDQVFRYLTDVKNSMETSMMLITHDISLVFESCDSIGVMHGGQLAESGSVTDVYDSPHHPYSLLLQKAFPDHRYPDRNLAVIEGTPPEHIGEGEVNFCSFADRCPWAIEECTAAAPPLEPVDQDPSHRAACVRKNEVDSFSVNYDREESAAQCTDGGEGGAGGKSR